MVTAVKERRDKYKVASILQGMSFHNNNIILSISLTGSPLSSTYTFSAQMGVHQQRQINCISITFLTRNIFLMNWQVFFQILKNNLMVTKSLSEKTMQFKLTYVA